MKKKLIIRKKIQNFKKEIYVDGDKSISIRSLLMASQSVGVCKIKNLLYSEDIENTIKSLKKLGVKIIFNKKEWKVYGNGLNGFKYKKNLKIFAGNSGTFARLILGLLIKTPFNIQVTGDKSLSKRDFLRIIKPLQKFGARFESKNGKLPLNIVGSEYIRPINYNEKLGSAQCKSSVMLAALNSPGVTYINAKKSRNHTENFFKFLKIPIKIKSSFKFDKIEIKGERNFNSFNYNIPSDPSSSAFFIVLTLLSKNSSIKIKNVNINDTRTGFIKILNKMGAKIKLSNKKSINGEKIADIFVKSQKSFKSISCPVKYNSNAIDEFLIIFLVAAKAKGVSTFSNLGELNKKESPRLKIGSELLNKIGIKTVLRNETIKIYGNPLIDNLRTIEIKNFLKDHRVFMTSVIAALTFGGKWIIHDTDSFKSSFPSFLSIIGNLGYKLEFK